MRSISFGVLLLPEYFSALLDLDIDKSKLGRHSELDSESYDRIDIKLRRDPESNSG